MRTSLKLSLAALALAPAALLVPAASPIVAQTTPPGYYEVPTVTPRTAAKTASSSAKKVFSKITISQLLNGKTIKIAASGAGKYEVKVTYKGTLVASGSRTVKKDTTKNAEIKLKPTTKADDLLEDASSARLSIAVTVTLKGKPKSTSKTSVTID